MTRPKQVPPYMVVTNNPELSPTYWARMGFDHYKDAAMTAERYRDLWPNTIVYVVRLKGWKQCVA